MEADKKDNEVRFSLVVGGPFHRALNHLGLTDQDELPTRAAAFSLGLAAWLLPALLVIVQSLLEEDYTGWGFFTDWTVHTRYLLAIWIMVVTERYADNRLGTLVHHFRAAHILAESSQPALKSALVKADRRSGSWLAELIILVVALAWSSLTTHYSVVLSGVSWDGMAIAGDSILSWSGIVASYISTPLFLFLVLRWSWRFLVWAVLLWRISRLPLQLTPLHPDRTAGLGFLAIYPSVFSGFIFALSCVIAAAMIKDIGLEERSAEIVWFTLGGWLFISVGLVLAPLLVFVRLLHNLRERALLEYGRLANQHHLAVHRKWIVGNINGERLLGTDDPASVSDLNATVEIVQQMRLLPVDSHAILQLVSAAGIPLLAVVMAQVPLGELLKWIVGAVL